MVTVSPFSARLGLTVTEPFFPLSTLTVKLPELEPPPEELGHTTAVPVALL